jgi:hypothetical protein
MVSPSLVQQEANASQLAASCSKNCSHVNALALVLPPEEPQPAPVTTAILSQKLDERNQESAVVCMRVTFLHQDGMQQCERYQIALSETSH